MLCRVRSGGERESVVIDQDRRYQGVCPLEERKRQYRRETLAIQWCHCGESVWRYCRVEIMWWNSKALVKNVKISCHSCCGRVLVGTEKAKVVCVVTIVGVLQYETVCVLGGEEGVKAGGNRGYQRAFGERGKHKQQ